MIRSLLIFDQVARRVVNEFASAAGFGGFVPLPGRISSDLRQLVSERQEPRIGSIFRNFRDLDLSKNDLKS